MRAAVVLGGELRAMTGYEEELVESQRSARNTAALCNELIARCLVGPGESPRAARERVAGLTTAERDLALVALRRKTYGDLVEMVADCPSCHEACAISFELSRLPLTLAAIPTGVEVELDDGRLARARLPTVADQDELLELGIESQARRRTWLLARTLTRLGEREGPFEEAELHALSSAARQRLIAALERALPSFDLSMEVSCQACHAQFVSPFQIDGFFLPS